VSKYEHTEVGFGERLDALQAAILGVKLQHLEDWVVARNRAAMTLTTLLEGGPVATPIERDGVRHAYHLYVVRSKDRDRMLEHLKGAGIGAGVHYPIPLHLQPAYAEGARVAGDLAQTERAAREVLSLPLYPEITDEQLRHTAHQVMSFPG
jgi:dTDP-4-amino-4,6-dideoxygalactose transaminase